MAFGHGKNGFLQVDDSTNTLQNISPYVDNVEFGHTLDPGETTTFGQTDKTQIVGLADGTLSASGKFDATQDGIIAGTFAAQIAGTLLSVSIVYGPLGNTTGFVKYTFESIITSYSETTPVGDVVTWSAEFQKTGAVTRSTF